MLHVRMISSDFRACLCSTESQSSLIGSDFVVNPCSVVSFDGPFQLCNASLTRFGFFCQAFEIIRRLSLDPPFSISRVSTLSPESNRLVSSCQALKTTFFGRSCPYISRSLTTVIFSLDDEENPNFRYCLFLGWILPAFGALKQASFWFFLPKIERVIRKP